MRKKISVGITPDILFHYVYTGKLVGHFFYFQNEFDGDVLCKHILVIVYGKIGDDHAIADACDFAGGLIVITLDVKGVQKVIHTVFRCSVNIQFQFLL